MKKNEGRFITAIFCDDIRFEAGGKMSYMGCYQDKIFVQSAPVLLSKLCVSVSIYTPKERFFKSLTIRVVQDDNLELARMEVSDKTINENQNVDKTSTQKCVNSAIVFSPFAIEKESMLRIMATTEEGEITGPRILIKIAEPQESAVRPSKTSKTAKPRTKSKI